MNKHAVSAAALIISSLCLTACHEESEHKKIENRAEEKVGKVYNHEIQGAHIENHDNQFFKSRLDSKENMSTATSTVNDSTSVESNKM